MSEGGPGNREQGLALACELILALERPHPLRVAIDGIDCAGKATLADELAPLLEARGRQIVRASIDGFHRPRAERLRRGGESPEGSFHDSFDHGALRRWLLEPLGPGGDAATGRRSSTTGPTSLEAVQPRRRADLVIGNDEPLRPTVACALPVTPRLPSTRPARSGR